ncbi:unnamed protein product [Pieris macdunnoughi]|uniref:Uncharacterized protein n=1 Tax=Pieris macdunnoughi TaxID=345717 RepID=A0A821SDE8_9NEOP|nr:unnamed protein product [Pieris macdunnoughi]
MNLGNGKMGLALNKTFVKMLKNQLFIPKRIVGVVRWLLVATGLLGTLGCLVFHFKDNIMRFAVSSDSPSKVKPEPDSNGQEAPPKIEM